MTINFIIVIIIKKNIHFCYTRVLSGSSDANWSPDRPSRSCFSAVVHSRAGNDEVTGDGGQVVHQAGAGCVMTIMLDVGCWTGVAWGCWRLFWWLKCPGMGVWLAWAWLKAVSLMFDLTLRMSASGGWRQGVDTWPERPAWPLAMDAGHTCKRG